jgi:hypothetical protein
LLESLVYAPDEATTQKVTELAGAYIANVKQLPTEQLATKKDDVKQLKAALDYLVEWKKLPADFPPKAEVDALIKAQRWDKK